MSEIDLKTFEINLIVRQLGLEDYEQVASLQFKCFPQMPTWTKEQFTSQVNIFPVGQLAIEYLGLLVASSSSLFLEFNLYSDWHS